MTRSKFIAAFNALLAVTRAHAETFSVARALSMMPAAARSTSLTSRL